MHPRHGYPPHGAPASGFARCSRPLPPGHCARCCARAQQVAQAAPPTRARRQGHARQTVAWSAADLLPRSPLGWLRQSRPSSGPATAHGRPWRPDSRSKHTSTTATRHGTIRRTGKPNTCHRYARTLYTQTDKHTWMYLANAESYSLSAAIPTTAEDLSGTLYCQFYFLSFWGKK